MQDDKICFVLMPFRDEFKNAWLYGIKPAAEKNNLKAMRADDETLPSGIITKDIRELIINAEIIVAEMTSQNPNVLYELGLAHSAKKKVIMITQDKEDVPFDIQGQGIRYIKYDKNHLDILEEKLANLIKMTINQNNTIDLFPELKIFTPDLKAEMQRLAEENKHLIPLAYPISITTEPKYAYIFLNNKYIGINPQTVYVNPNVCNIITVFALEHFEEYIVLNGDDIKNRSLNISLSLRDKKLYPQRVHNWLKYIRENPDDIVIGRAIGVYLEYIGEHEEGISELDRLINICDNWSMLYNGIGYFKVKLGLFDEAISFYKKVKKLENNTYVGYFNLACLYSLLKKFDLCISEIEKIVKNEERLLTMCYINKDGRILDSDSDFDNIRNNEKYKIRFNEFNDLYKQKCAELAGSH